MNHILKLPLCFSLLISCFQSAISQLHYPDERWPIGSNQFPGSDGYGNAWIHFQGDTITIEEAILNMDFESTVAVASNENGELLFYSNGCEIRNANGELMENGEGLNPGPLHDWVCDGGYTVPKGMLALPLPDSPTKWLLLHTGGKYDPINKLLYGPFYSTEIDMGANNGQGAVVSKNNILSDKEIEPFAVVRHGNGRDWWVVVPEYTTNHYQVWLLDPTGISLQTVQEIGPAIGCRRIGSSVFSQDGSKYARTNNCSAVVLDFDRCGGVFSNPIPLERPPHTLGGGGLAFSDNNRWLYATSQLCIFRADLESNAPFLDSLFKQPYYEGVSDYVFGTSLAYMQWAPDGKVYMNAQHREKFLSAISLENDTFQYEQGILPLPVYAVRTLPNFPNFRLYDEQGSICDSLSIDGPPLSIHGPVFANAGIFIYPNSAKDKLTIDSNQCKWQPSEIHIYDIYGREALRLRHPEFIKIFTFNLPNITPGIYWCKVSDGRSHHVFQKLSIVN
ncbi:MAG: T9SS type A sorting domain-containing protein [Saprospiraceae bacterium]